MGLHEHDVAVFLVGLAVLLGAARLLGELARARKLPGVVGELLAGVLLGPTVLGRIAPGATQALFPAGAPATMLGTYTLLASVLLLTLAGLEVDLHVVVQRRREAAVTSLSGVLVPLVLGIALGLILPSRYLVDPERRWLFALFVGTALSISAMPVIARTLLDLGFLRTSLGLLVMASAMIDDLVGWLLFSLLAAPMRGQSASWVGFALRVAGIAAFAAAVLTLGSRALDRVLGQLELDRVSAPGRVLSVLFVAAVLGAAGSQALGVHAVFGAFMVGVAAARSPHLRAETRARVHEFVGNVFAPVFFAAVGLRVDFAAAFDPLLVGAVLVVAVAAKAVGCAVGARAGGLAWREAWGVGFAMNSRGAMEILLALVALEAGLIRPPLFVALVVMALVTSLLAGPAMSRLLRPRETTDVAALLEEGAVVLALRARTAEQAVRELAQALAAGTPLDDAALAEAAIEQDAHVRGGLADGIALAHARIDAGLTRPMLALGRSAVGVDFNARDGQPARLVFLLLLPEAQAARLLELHMPIVYAVATSGRRAALLGAETRAEVLEAVRASRVTARSSGSYPAMPFPTRS